MKLLPSLLESRKSTVANTFYKHYTQKLKKIWSSIKKTIHVKQKSLSFHLYDRQKQDVSKSEGNQNHSEMEIEKRELHPHNTTETYKTL